MKQDIKFDKDGTPMIVLDNFPNKKIEGPSLTKIIGKFLNELANPNFIKEISYKRWKKNLENLIDLNKIFGDEV